MTDAITPTLPEFEQSFLEIFNRWNRGRDWGNHKNREWKTATDIVREMGITRHVQIRARMVAELVRKLNGGTEKAEKRTSTGRFFSVPPGAWVIPKKKKILTSWQIQAKFSRWFERYWDENLPRCWKKTSEIAQEMGIEWPDRIQRKLIDDFIRKLNNNAPTTRKRNTKVGFHWVPQSSRKIQAIHVSADMAEIGATFLMEWKKERAAREFADVAGLVKKLYSAMEMMRMEEENALSACYENSLQLSPLAYISEPGEKSFLDDFNHWACRRDWTEKECEWKIATQIAQEMGIDRPVQWQTKMIGQIVRKLNGNDVTKEKRTSRGKLWAIPIIRDREDNNEKYFPNKIP